MRAGYSVFAAFMGKDGKKDNQPHRKTDVELTEYDTSMSDIEEETVNAPGEKDPRYQQAPSMFDMELKRIQYMASDDTSSRFVSNITLTFCSFQQEQLLISNAIISIPCLGKSDLPRPLFLELLLLLDSSGLSCSFFGMLSLRNYQQRI